MVGHFPSPSGRTALPPGYQQPPAHQQPVATPQRPVGAVPGGHVPGQPAQRPLAIALRAWVPQEYAGHLASHGLHVIAAGGELTVEQASAWGAQVLLVSSECLGSHTHLLTNPKLPTVFVAPQQMMIPAVPGVVQVHEPLRASEVASASRQATADWAQGRR